MTFYYGKIIFQLLFIMEKNVLHLDLIVEKLISKFKTRIKIRKYQQK